MADRRLTRVIHEFDDGTAECRSGDDGHGFSPPEPFPSPTKMREALEQVSERAEGLLGLQHPPRVRVLLTTLLNIADEALAPARAGEEE